MQHAGYDDVLDVEKEDREIPGPPGIALGRQYLAQFLPPREDVPRTAP